MKNLILFASALLILLFTACEEEKEDFDACHCGTVMKNKSNSNAPVLGFYETYKSKELGEFLNSVILDSNHFQIDSIQTNENDFVHSSEFLQKFRVNIGNDNRFVDDPQLGFALGEDTSRINEILSFHIEENWFEVDKIKFAWSKKIKNFLSKDGDYYSLYALKLDAGDQARFSSKGVESAQHYIDPRDNEVSITVIMNEEGTQKWSQMTLENIGNYIAMVSGDKVLSAPVIMAPITGGQTRISGGLIESEAQDLVDLINCEAHKRELGKAAFLEEMAGCSND